MSEQRDRILSCACVLYLQDGLDGFSMRKLARVLGVTAPALYRHYESKERVLLDVVGEAYRTMIQYLHRALQGRTPEDRFRLAGQGFLDFALEHPRYYEVLFMGVELLAVEAVRAEVREQGCAVGQFWNDRVREAIDAGMLEPGDPEAIGMTLWAHSHGLLSLYLKGMLPMEEGAFRALVKSSGARVLSGLGTRAFAARVAEAAAAPFGVARSTMEVG
jgi:AcrR family transcriptional regulator